MLGGGNSITLQRKHELLRTFREKIEYYTAHGENHLPTMVRDLRLEYFRDYHFLLDTLARLGIQLKSYPLADRNLHLRRALSQCNALLYYRMLSQRSMSTVQTSMEDFYAYHDITLEQIANLCPAAACFSLHLPLQHSRENALRILRFVENECEILPSKDRVPYLIVVELLEQPFPCKSDELYTEGRKISLSAEDIALGKHTYDNPQVMPTMHTNIYPPKALLEEASHHHHHHHHHENNNNNNFADISFEDDQHPIQYQSAQKSSSSHNNNNNNNNPIDKEIETDHSHPAMTGHHSLDHYHYDHEEQSSLGLSSSSSSTSHNPHSPHPHAHNPSMIQSKSTTTTTTTTAAINNDQGVLHSNLFARERITVSPPPPPPPSSQNHAIPTTSTINTAIDGYRGGNDDTTSSTQSNNNNDDYDPSTSYHDLYGNAPYQSSEQQSSQPPQDQTGSGDDAYITAWKDRYSRISTPPFIAPAANRDDTMVDTHNNHQYHHYQPDSYSHQQHQLNPHSYQEQRNLPHMHVSHAIRPTLNPNSPNEMYYPPPSQSNHPPHTHTHQTSYSSSHLTAPTTTTTTTTARMRGIVRPKTWEEKKSLIQSLSPFGKLPGWTLRSFIVKSGDDLSKEILAIQIIEYCVKIFQQEGIDIYLRPYQIVNTGFQAGLVEFLEGAISIDRIKKLKPNKSMTLPEYFSLHFGDSYSFIYAKAIQNFVKSLVGYSLMTYLAQVRDRHNANLLIDQEGHIVHIDYGFIFGGKKHI
jgi:hypothetical protein